MAYSKCPKMPEIPVEWASNTTLTSIRKTQTAFYIHTKAGEKAFTFTLTFPVIGGVRLTESKGFFDCTETLPITYGGKKMLKLTAGAQTVLFRKDQQKGFVLDICNSHGKSVLSIDGDSILFGFAGNKLKKVKKILFKAAFEKGEVLYGLGERYNTLNQVGHDALLWNVDTAIHGPNGDNGADHNESYQCVPVLHSSKGYMLFVNSMYGAWMDCGKKLPHVYSMDFNGPTADFFIFTGTPKENLKSYTDLTGHTIIPPKWAFQYWMGNGAPQWENPENRGERDYYQKLMREYIDGYAQMGIHHIAACYGEGAPSVNKEGYEIAQEVGMRMLMWTHPSQEIEFSKKVLGTEDPTQLPQIVDRHHKRIPVECTDAWVDFTHPSTKPVIREYMKKYFDWGLKGAMADFGEFVPVEARMYNGKDGNAMHNEHSYWYAKTMKEIFEERCGEDWVLFQRSGCAGSQSFVGQFGGDQAARFYGLKQAYYAGLTISASGFNIWGSDIAGYNGVPTPELYMRWLEFSALSPLMRAHGIFAPRNPWAYGDIAVGLFKRLYWWRENMLDYLYSTAIHAHHTAEPIMRVMAIEFPEEELAAVDTQYMFGSELLVAPVIEEGRQCKMVVFPKGDWVNLWTGESIKGDRRVVVEAKNDDVPVYLRAGAAMVLKVPADTCNICENMEDKACISALLVTPANTRREVTHWVDKNTCVTFFTDKQADEAVTVENPDGFRVGALLIYGIEAEKVLADGKDVVFAAEGDKTVIKTADSFKKLQVWQGNEKSKR